MYQLYIFIFSFVHLTHSNWIWWDLRIMTYLISFKKKNFWQTITLLFIISNISYVLVGIDVYNLNIVFWNFGLIQNENVPYWRTTLNMSKPLIIWTNFKSWWILKLLSFLKIWKIFNIQTCFQTLSYLKIQKLWE